MNFWQEVKAEARLIIVVLMIQFIWRRRNDFCEIQNDRLQIRNEASGIKGKITGASVQKTQYLERKVFS